MNAVQYAYNNSPFWLQNIACTYKGLIEKKLRFGGNFENYYNFLIESQWMANDEIQVYQNEKLSFLIKYCYYNIPYYNKLFKQLKLVPGDIRTVDDLTKVPILTKEGVRNNFSLLKNPNYNKGVIKTHTSGSTGKALDFLFSRDAIKFRWALWFRHRERFGVKPYDRYATFTGLVVVPINQKKTPFWRENYAMKQTIFTMHHISVDKVKHIVNRLNKGEFVYYSGYPSILYSLATLIEDANLRITNPPKVIFTGAEALLEVQRRRISRVFNSIVTDQYGFSEGAGNASRCESDLFHEDFEYGILECNNGIVNGNYITGEVIGTGFTNLAMPFIRYKIEDTATWVNTNCKCRRKSKTILKVEGRNEDYILTPEGNRILRFDYIFKDMHNITEAQVIQRELGEIIIKIVRRTNYSISDEKRLKNEVKTRVSPQLAVRFEYVNEIARERTGKFRAVKSYLK